MQLVERRMRRLARRGAEIYFASEIYHSLNYHLETCTDNFKIAVTLEVRLNTSQPQISTSAKSLRQLSYCDLFNNRSGSARRINQQHSWIVYSRPLISQGTILEHKIWIWSWIWMSLSCESGWEHLQRSRSERVCLAINSVEAEIQMVHTELRDSAGWPVSRGLRDLRHNYLPYKSRLEYFVVFCNPKVLSRFNIPLMNRNLFILHTLICDHWSVPFRLKLTQPIKKGSFENTLEWYIKKT